LTVLVVLNTLLLNMTAVAITPAAAGQGRPVKSWLGLATVCELKRASRRAVAAT
jgi:hypothetical protein